MGTMSSPAIINNTLDVQLAPKTHLTAVRSERQRRTVKPKNTTALSRTQKVCMGPLLLFCLPHHHRHHKILKEGGLARVKFALAEELGDKAVWLKGIGPVRNRAVSDIDKPVLRQNGRRHHRDPENMS